jgi:glycosyltransferase involved in cell wall biosynthesis
MRVICLITPGHLSTNPRLVKEADALAGAGYSVAVIAADYAGWAREADAEFADRPWRLAARLRFGPDARLGERVVQVGRQRLARWAFRAGFRPPALANAAWHPIGPDLLRAALAVRAELYIAHYPAALPAAAAAAQAHGARYAFDAEDFHLGDPPEEAAFDEVRSMTRAIESSALPSCAYISAASPGIADAYAEAYGIARPTVIRNVFPRAHSPLAATLRGCVSPGPSLYWFSQTIGPDRGLECAAQAIGLARSRPHLYLRGQLQQGFGERLQTAAARADAAGRVHCLPPAAPSEMERLAAAHDVGLVGETGRTPNRRIALTNKLFSYALAGVPAMISDIPAHRDYAREAGLAARLYPVDDAAELAAALDELLGEDGRPLAEARAQAYALGQEQLNWDREQAVFLTLVKDALA